MFDKIIHSVLNNKLNRSIKHKIFTKTIGVLIRMVIEFVAKMTTMEYVCTNTLTDMQFTYNGYVSCFCLEFMCRYATVN